MPQPNSNQVHVDAILTNISVAYQQDQGNFIAERVFPVVPVQKQTDKYYKYKKDDWFRDEMRRRADASESAGSGYNLDTDGYSCDVWALHKDIGPQARANVDSPLNLDEDATRFLTQQGLIRRERQWAGDFFAAGKWGTDKAGNNDFPYWSDFGASDPEADIDLGKKTMLQNTGYMPNTLVVGYAVHQALKKHPLTLDRFKYTSADSITEAMIARYLDVPRYLVAKSIYAANREGAAENMQFIHGNHALLCYSAPAPSLLMPSAGYTFTWQGFTGLNNLGTVIRSFFLDKEQADRIEIEMAFDMKLVAADLGYFFNGAVN